MNYHIVIEIDSMTYFDCADTREEANAIAEHYMEQHANQICIYARDNDSNGYTLAMRAKRNAEERRLIGFCRW